MKTKKKVAIICIVTAGVLLLAFAVLNVFWFVYYHKCIKYRDKLEVQTIAGETSYGLSKGDYNFGILMPTYLDFSCYIHRDYAILMEMGAESDPSKDISVRGWIHLFQDNTYALGAMNPDDKSMWEIYIDKNGNPVFQEDEDPSYIEKVNEIMDYNRDLIDDALEEFDSVFGLT